MKVAVIGSNSFSGSDFIDLLLEDPNGSVIGFSRSPEKSAFFLPYLARSQRSFHFYQADLNTDTDRILDVLDDFMPEYVINFAAQSEVAPSWIHPEQWFETNTVALAKLINKLKDRRYLHRYVHISSPEAYGSCETAIREDAPLDPSTPYAASKAAADMLLATFRKQYGFPLVTIRATNVYGAHQQLFKIIPRSVIYLKLGRTIMLHGGGRAVKSYIHIRDVSKGTLKAMRDGEVGAIYHLSPDRGYSIREIVERICAEMGRDFAAATEDTDERPGQDAAYVIDSTRARSTLGWLPQTSLDQGLAGVVTWVEDNWDAIRAEQLDYVHRP